MNKGEFLNNFNIIIQNLNNIVYKPNNLMITNLKEEKQNAEYAGCLFHLNNKTIRFRKSKVTPNKIGQFVFWEKDENMRNRAFSYEAAPDLLVITCIADNKLGNLFFLKRFFLKKNIENTKVKQGKWQ